MIASGSSERGIVGGDDHAVRQSRRDLPHQRPLAAVTIAAAAEHDMQRPSSAPRRREDVFERVGRVRVVDENGERLSFVDGLEASGNLSGGVDRRQREIIGNAERRAAASARARCRR